MGRVDWNATIIWTLRRDLAYQWVIILEQEIPDLFDALSDDVETVLEDLKQSVLGRLFRNSPAPSPRADP